MDTPVPDDVDPVWWSARNKYVVRDYCRICEPDVDPTKEMVNSFICWKHEDKLTGVDDARSKAPEYYPNQPEGNYA